MLVWCCCDLVAFICGSVAMGCLFRCFGIQDDRSRPSLPHLVAHQLPPIATAGAVLNSNRKRLGLLLSEDKEGSVCEEKKCNLVGGSEDDCDFRALKDEAKFLKACGTLPETPAEIRKSSKLLADSPSNGDSESRKFHSWLPNTSIQKLNLEMQAELTPTTKFYDELTGSGSLANTPSRQIPARISTSSTDDSGSVHSGIGILNKTNQNTSVQFRSRSVQFDCPSGGSTISSKGSSSGVSCESSKQSTEAAGNASVSKPSPYPTPLQLSDDMQTPGTVFPSYIRNRGNEMNPKIRSQHVCSVLNPVDNLSQWNVLKEEDSNSNQQSGHLIESLEQADQATPLSEVGMIKDSVKEGFEMEASLSSWLKPVNQNGNNQRVVSFDREKTYYGKNLGDRPIIGMVAAHWTEEAPQRISPKWWDGNGIPNSTTKYKEDQKVSWHATTFEERLEKALSEETSTSQRKKNPSRTSPIDFNEHEECDTAISQRKSSTHFSSVVSC